MLPGNLSRRGFLSHSLSAMVGAGLPLWYAKEIFAFEQAQKAAQRVPGANDRLVMGAIGTGTDRFKHADLKPTRGERGVAIMRDAMNQPGVQMIATCDVDSVNARYAADDVNKKNNNTDCKTFENYKELLQNRDIDAVTIGTPDHWHATVAIAALKAGKHVYCEKPLTLTLEEGKALVKVQKDTGKTLQTGSQQRSDARFRLACEMVRNGRIGRVQKITTLIGSNPVGGPFPTEEVPAGLNWDMWLGPTAKVDFAKRRCHYEFRWWYEYSGGKMTDWGAHHNDIAQWGLGMDDSGPTSVYVASAVAPSTDRASYNCHPEFEVVYGYGNGANGAEGTKLHCKSSPQAEGWKHPNNGVLFEGENGQFIFVSRGTIYASDGDAKASKILNEPLGQNATRLEVSTNHMGNFMAGIRDRKPPITNATVGHRSCSVCHLGVIALRMGRNQDRPLRWDPREEKFIGNENDANGMLGRPARAPYVLGV